MILNKIMKRKQRKKPTKTFPQTMNLTELDEYSLLEILKYLPSKDIQSMHQTCKQFHSLIENCLYLAQSGELLMTGHKLRHNFVTFQDHNYCNRIRLNLNWKKGRYLEMLFFRRNARLCNRIFLERDTFYMSQRGAIRIYERDRTEIIKRHATEIGNANASDVSCFTKYDQTIFAGRTNGSIMLYENGETLNEFSHSPSNMVQSVDIYKNFMVSAAYDDIKFYNKYLELDMLAIDPIGTKTPGFKCVKISPDGNRTVAGMYQDIERNALRLFDNETLLDTPMSCRSMAIYDVLWTNETTLLAAAYDSSLQMYDTRTAQCTNTWRDTYDSAIYCLDYDGGYGVLCGMAHHCRVTMYDLRMTGKFVQMYYPALNRTYGSPVYGLKSDANLMFISTDQNLRIFNFDVRFATSKDFSHLFNIA